MKVSSTSALALVAALAFGMTGCKLLKKPGTGDAGADGGSGASATAGGAGNAQDQADYQLQEKIDEYVKCLNTLSSNIHSERRTYLAYVPKNGPTGKENDARIYKLPAKAASNCAEGVAKAKAMPPADAKIEGVAKEYSDAATDIDGLINDIFVYFDGKNFKDDKWAKGKAQHPKLMAAWSRFSKADTALHQTLDGITKPLAQRSLARIEREEGKKFSYHRKHTLITARELVEAGDPSGEDEDIDYNLYGAAYTDYEKSMDDLVAYGTANKKDLSDKKTPAWPLAESNYDQFVSKGGDFKKSSKEFWRCLRDAPAKAKAPSGKVDPRKLGNCAEGPAGKQAEKVIKDYNEFIHTSNDHQFP